MADGENVMSGEMKEDFNKAESFIKEHEPESIDSSEELKMCLVFAYELYKHCYENNIFDIRHIAAKYALDIIQNNVKSEKAEFYKDDELVQAIIDILEFVFEEEYYYTDLVKTMKTLIGFDSVCEKSKLEMMRFLVETSIEPETNQALGDDYYKYIKYFPDIEKKLSKWRKNQI